MNLSETNYMLLMRLISSHETVGQLISYHISSHLSYRLEIIEVTRYTSVIIIQQVMQTNTSYIERLMHPKMRIRLYHDARMVDILSTQGLTNIKPRYDYPNEAMHHPDEKQQMSLFLKEWLQLSLSQGRVKFELPLS
jgi:hypothetical protein